MEEALWISCFFFFLGFWFLQRLPAQECVPRYKDIIKLSLFMDKGSFFLFSFLGSFLFLE